MDIGENCGFGVITTALILDDDLGFLVHVLRNSDRTVDIVDGRSR
jgi:hypothetical protein